MKKFSAGGAQGRYDRRIADIEKDRKIALAKGKNADVVEAKAAQRKADAEDDKAKRMGLDRTATRKAEYDAEQRLSRTRKFGADKPAAAAEPAKASTPEPAKASTPEPAKAKPQTTRQEFNAAFSAARAKAIKEGRDPNKEPFMFGGKKKVALMAGAGASSSRTVTANSSRTNNNTATPPASTNNNAAAAAAAKAKQDAAAKAAAAKAAAAKAAAAKAATPKIYGPSTKGPLNPNSIAGMIASGKLFETSDAFKKAQAAKYGYGKAKGGKLMKKYAKGGSTPPQPTPADRKADAKFRESVKKIKVTPAQGKTIESAGRYAKGGVTKQMPSSNQMGDLNMAKGGKTKMKPAAKGKGNPFAATKFGAAMMKKSGDTEGRAMKKFAKGGSIDGCAVKGKTKTKMVAMKKGGKTC
jgi:hypothetical protein